MIAVEELVRDCRWLPHRLNADGTRIDFVRLERDDHRAVTFLEDQYFQDRFPVASAPIRDVAAAAAALDEPAPLRFLFHSSMALSTLAARLFDAPGVSMALKEPIILNQLATLARQGKQIRPALALLLRLLSRPFAPGEAIVIKPGNTANILIGDMMTVRRDARALILYAPLGDFLRSIAKKGMWGRIVYRRLYALLARDDVLDAGFSDAEIFEQTDLQITAMVWLIHHAQFAALMPQLDGRVRTVDSESFLADRRASVDHLARFFDIALDVDAVLAGPLFRQHSKELGRTFDAEQRRHEHEASGQAYGEEIAMVTGWAQKVASHCGVPLELCARLLS